MRASILTFIFILSEYSIITGGHGNCGDPPEIENAEKVNSNASKVRVMCKEGYMRQAGTSNLYKCENNQWKNSLPLKCIRLDILMPPVSSSPSISAPKTPGMDKHPGKNTSTTNGKIAFTTTHKAPTTPWTFHHTSQRPTTTEETPVTTSITDKIPALSTTEKEIITTSSEVAANERSREIGNSAGGIAGGIGLIAILGVAACIVAILFWRRRRRRADPVEMSIQNPVTPFRDTPESTYTDAHFSA